MSRLVIGIDPGQKGGLAVISLDFKEINVVVMPAIHNFCSLIHQMKQDILRVFIEQGQSMPGNSGKSMFNYGVGIGQMQGVLISLAIPFESVRPAVWHKSMTIGSAGDTAKKKSLEACRRLFPLVDLTPGKRKVPHDGLVDALLIAEYGRRSLINAKPA